MVEIVSWQNPKIKNLVKLQQKSRERKKQNLFVVEGIKENKMAIGNGYLAQSVFLCLDIASNKHLKFPNTTKIYSVSQEIYNKLSYRSGTEGIISIYQTKHYNLDSIQPSKNDLFIVLESVEKPGNLGAILRSCDGAAVKAVFLCDSLVDLYNPNAIRSSLGTIFNRPIIPLQKENIVQFCKENKVQILPTYLSHNTKSLYASNLQQSTAFVLGTEATGLSSFWQNKGQNIKIPMLGKADSLNLSNAAAICMYEFVRQNHR